MNTPQQIILACYLQDKGQRDIISAGIDDFDFEVQEEKTLMRLICGATKANPYLSLDEIRQVVNASKEKDKEKLHKLIDYLITIPALWSKYTLNNVQEETQKRGFRELGGKLVTTGAHFTLGDAMAAVNAYWEWIKAKILKEPVRNADEIAVTTLETKEEDTIPLHDDAMVSIFGASLRKRLYIIAGRPSMGKNIILDTLVAKELAPQCRGVYVSWDNDDSETALKLKCYACDMNYSALRSKMYGEQKISIIHSHRFTFPPIITSRTATAYQLRAYVEAIKSNYPDLKWVAIDYFQNVKVPDNQRSNQTQALENAVLEIKRISSELKLTVLLLSQVGRGVEKDADGEVNLHDMKSTSSLEQEAYYVVGVGGKRDENKRKISILKNKDGRHGSNEYIIEFGLNKIRLDRPDNTTVSGFSSQPGGVGTANTQTFSEWDL